MVAWFVTNLFIATVTMLSSDRYAFEVAMLAVIDPAWSDVPVEVVTVTVPVVPVSIWTVAALLVPKSPTHVKFRSTSAGVARDNVTVKVTLWASSISVAVAVMDTVRSSVDPVPGVENSLSPAEFVASTCTWYSVLTFRPVMVAVVAMLV